MGLFGMFDHVIPLKLDTRLTIVYGENGIGKTMLFRILHALFSKDFKRLNTLPFQKLELLFENGNWLHVRREEGKMWVSSERLEEEEVRFVKKVSPYDENFLTYIRSLNDHVQERFRSRLIQVIDAGDESYSVFFASLMGALKIGVPLANVIDEFPNAIPNLVSEFPDHFREFFTETTARYSSKVNQQLFRSTCYLIGTNRLLYAKDENGHQNGLFSRYQQAISVYSDEMAALIKEKHEEYQRTSDQLELSLRKRLSSGELAQDFSAQQLRDLSEQLSHRRKELREAGLWDEQDEDPAGQLDNLSDVQRAILGVNMADTQEKLRVFDELYERIHLFLEIINRRRFSYKTLSIRPGKGFVVTNANEEPLSLNDLSSGEQHELVLLFQLLFKVPPKSLILIDEPEISLHIAWQKAFIDDMLEIIRLRDLDIMVATHSPSIINGRWDEHTVALKGNVLVNG